MHFKIFIFFSSLILINCSSSKYELFVEDFPGADISEAAQKQCQAENPEAPTYACDIKRCISSPIVLLGLEDMLITVDAALKKVGIPYFLDAGTLIGANRFGAPLPWDDDHDLGVLAKDFPASKRTTLMKELNNNGIEMKTPHEPSFISDVVGLAGLYHLALKKDKFIKNVLSYDKKHISMHDAEELWLEYDSRGRFFPHLDIFVFVEEEPGKYSYEAGMFSKIKHDKKILESITEIKILGKLFPQVKDFMQYSRNTYGTDKIVTDFVIYPDHKAGCPRIRLKNIKDHPEYLKFFDDYLRWVFGSRYQGLTAKLK